MVNSNIVKNGALWKLELIADINASFHNKNTPKKTTINAYFQRWETHRVVNEGMSISDAVFTTQWTQ